MITASTKAGCAVWYAVLARQACEPFGEGRFVMEVVPRVMHAQELPARGGEGAVDLRLAEQRELSEFLEELSGRLLPSVVSFRFILDGGQRAQSASWD